MGSKNVKNMRNMFLYARRFNRNLDKWNVFNVMDFDNIFAYSDFVKMLVNGILIKQQQLEMCSYMRG